MELLGFARYLITDASYDHSTTSGTHEPADIKDSVKLAGGCHISLTSLKFSSGTGLV